ncbi:MAG: hypothetical protein N2319_00660, partial [Candidatus Kapabacteria bacterium]|nr:hypothetical protein [Candidatus Kapabacteria bacterium]
MPKKLLYLTIVLNFLLSFNLFSQYDGRKLPPSIDVEQYEKPLIFKMKDYYKAGKLPPEAFIEHKLPDNLMSPTGVNLINMSGTSGHQSETWISINPMNPLQIVGSANDYRYNDMSTGYRMAAYYTTDGGNSWKTSTTPRNMDLWIKRPTQGGMTNFDPGLAFDTKGNIYYSYGFCQVPDDDLEGDNGVFVSRSSDGGKTWQEPIPIALETNGTVSQPFHDRYMIACDVQENSPFKNTLYVTWKRFRINPGICFSSSKDEGETWSTITLIPGGGGNTQSPTPVVGPNGELYVAWQSRGNNNTTDAMVQKSTDGGKRWLPAPVLAQTVRNHGIVNSESGRNVLPDKQNIRISSYPAIAVDCSNGPRRGWVYVVQSGKASDANNGIFYTYSTDGGNKWSEQMRIDDNPLGNDVFFPAISVDPITGMIAVLYYSSQNDPQNKGVDAYLAMSFDGVKFSNIRITPQTWYINDPSDVSYQGKGNYYWGDYSSVVAYNGKVYPCFWMPSNPQGNFWTNFLYTAIMSTAPNPPTQLQFEIPNQNSIVLKWVDPTLNGLGGPIGNFKILVYRDNNKIGEVDKGVQSFTDNNIEDGKIYNYSLKTKAEDNSESEFVYISVTAGGALEPKAPTDLTPYPVANGVRLRWKNPSQHIDNSFFHDFDRIEIYNENKLVMNVNKPNIQAGEFTEAVIELPTEKFYKFKILAVGKRGTIETKSKYSEEILAYAGSPLTTLNESFDNSELVPHYLESNGDQKWGKTNEVSYTPNFSFTDSPNENYANRINNKVIFAPVFVQPQNTTLSFKHICIIDSTGDYGILSVSKDLKNWDDLLWFDSRRSKDFVDDPKSAKWFSEGRSLEKYAGDIVYVSFSLVSNPLRNKAGWFIDDLAINNDPLT